MSADAVYSATLVIAFLAGVVAIAGAVAGRTATAWSSLGSGSVRPSAVLAWVAVLASFGVHLLLGHPPGSTRALPPFEFVREHVSFIVAAAFPIVAFVIRGRLGKRRADPRSVGDRQPHVALGAGPRPATVRPSGVTVVPYDPEWPRLFESERAILEALFVGAGARIEHVGSTAVPGLGAKPVIDIVVGLARLSDAEDRIGLLEAADYEYVPEYEAQIPERRYFRKPRSGPRAFHVHCVREGGALWSRHLAFRDYLRAHPETSADYYRLKCELALRLPKGEYTEAKSEFIERILDS